MEGMKHGHAVVLCMRFTWYSRLKAVSLGIVDGDFPIRVCGQEGSKISPSATTGLEIKVLPGGETEMLAYLLVQG